MYMNENINRVIKGYKPKSDKYYYWILHDLVVLVGIIKLRIFKR